MSMLSPEVESLVKSVDEMQRTNSPEAIKAVEVTVQTMLASTQFLSLFSFCFKDYVIYRELLTTVNKPHAIFLVATSLKNIIGTADGTRLGDYIQYRLGPCWLS